MKKLLFCIITLTLLFSVSGCKKQSKEQEVIDNQSSIEINEKQNINESEKNEVQQEKKDNDENQQSESNTENKNLNENTQSSKIENQNKASNSKTKEKEQEKNETKQVVTPSTPTPTITSKPEPTSTSKVIPTPSPKNQKSDMEIAIEEQLSIGDPVTYYNGHPISINECHSIGGDLKARRETTLVNRYECVYTTYGDATAVGLIVQFTIDGKVYRESYDEYNKIMK